MSKLTSGEIEDLQAFFASPLSAALGHTIAAQSYEPRGKQGYDPTTDTKLAALVFKGKGLGKSAWGRTKQVLEQLAAPTVEVLRLLANGGEDAIASEMPRALAAGRKLAEDAQRTEHLHAILARPGSPMTVAVRVLEAERLFVPSPLSRHEVRYAARRAIELELVDVSGETGAVVDGAVAAYRSARDLVASWQASTKAKDDARRADFRAALADRRAAKERSWYERTLRSAS